MKIENIIVSKGEKIYKLKIQRFSSEDREILKNIFIKWRDLYREIKKYSTRSINLPELISEGLWCIYSGSVRILKNHSADTYNERKKVFEQIKATIIDGRDLTSFGPASQWDELYFLDFYRLDGSFDIYQIPKGILKHYKVNKSETFEQQQNQKRRPRLSIKNMISELNIKPLEENCRLFDI